MILILDFTLWTHPFLLYLLNIVNAHNWFPFIVILFLPICYFWKRDIKLIIFNFIIGLLYNRLLTVVQRAKFWEHTLIILIFFFLIFHLRIYINSYICFYRRTMSELWFVLAQKWILFFQIGFLINLLVHLRHHVIKIFVVILKISVSF